MKKRTVEDKQSLSFFKPCLRMLACVAIIGIITGCQPNGVPSDRSLDLENAPNARDAGGYTTQDGNAVSRNLLYRSDRLSSIKQIECDVIRTLGIKTIIDVRTDKEKRSAPDAACLLDFAQYKPVPIDLGGLSHKEAYKSFATEPKIPAAIAAISNILADRDNLPVLIHCSAGKDRTGGIIALVHLLLGVHPDDIMADYLLSRRAGRNVKAEWLQAALDQVDAEGGIEVFLSNRGIGLQIQQAVRANLLQDRTEDL